MTARHKLNIAYFNGSLLLAGFIGIAAQSFLVFFVALAMCIGLEMYSKNIRM